MNLRKVFLAWVLLSSATLFEPRGSFADDWITVTDCKVVIVNGLEQQEVTFDLHNLSTLTIYNFAIWPDFSASPDDTCHIVSAPSSENWVTFPTNDGGYIWSVATGDKKIPGGGSSIGIKATFSRTSCCWHANFAGVTDPFGYMEFCTPCLTTGAQASTWGRLKSQYR